MEMFGWSTFQFHEMLTSAKVIGSMELVTWGLYFALRIVHWSVPAKLKKPAEHVMIYEGKPGSLLWFMKVPGSIPGVGTIVMIYEGKPGSLFLSFTSSVQN